MTDELGFHAPHSDYERGVNEGWRRAAGAIPASSGATSLDEAWAAVEAALPEGWVFDELSSRWGTRKEPWQATARYHWIGAVSAFMEAVGSGPTPTAALQALAAKLTENSR